MTGEFQGTRVAVTGAGRGVGRGVAEAFAAAGAQVMLGARTLSYAQDAVAAIRAKGGIAEAVESDISRREDCRRLVEATVTAFGGLDVLIHCAADIPHGGLGAVSDERMEAGLASIAKAAWWLLEAARPHMAQAPGGGRFIAVGSVNGTVSVVPNMTAYGMAKAALLAFVRGAAVDVVGEGITVNAIQPGLIASDHAREVLGDEGLAAYGSTVPVGRAGTPADIAHACLFLASPRSDYITGASLVMDGGSSLAPARGGRGDVLQDRLKTQVGR
ncbi:SDR family NAD(P)-dependent oxidoreductase [Novosphingobium sp.]|uniref:SDR family NAD(P)-dependent oxidoreductase n=1 Tax=Novosphingobium sp. TaxID=1874826 RepID=UPI0035B0F26C